MKKLKDDRIKKTKFRIIIVKDSYFFLVQKGFENKYYENEHTRIRGWYTGILSFKRENSDSLHIFISKILYDNTDAVGLFLKILYQIFIHLDLDFLKLKYKKRMKHLKNYLSKILPQVPSYDPSVLYDVLYKEDVSLFEEAKVVVPHMSLYNLIDKLPSFEEAFYLNNIKSYLQPSEYMAPNHGKSHH